MKQELTIGERFVALQLLPQEGNIVTLKVIRELRENLSLSVEEIQEYDVKQTDERISWNPIKSQMPKPIELSTFGIDLLKSKLKKLNEDNILEDKHFSLYVKIVEGGV